MGTYTPTISVETQQGIPTQGPTNVSVSVINATAVEVKFDSPPQQFWNGKLTIIVARTWPPGRPGDQREYRTHYDSSSHKHQTFIHPQLKPDTEYTLSVAVATTGGASPGSPSVQFKTQVGKPGMVRSLQATGIYSDAFSLRWKLPFPDTGKITGYRIQYMQLNSGQGWLILNVDAKVTGAVVKDLEPRRKYQAKVAAMTSAGEGPYSAISVETIESPTLPKAPSDLKAYGIWGQNISLGWTPGDSGRAVIRHYRIEYNNDTDYHTGYPNARWWRVIRNLTRILENPANISGLVPSTTYRFRMRAFNRIGFSPYSNISEDITTGQGIPNKAPNNIIAIPRRQGLDIQWTPPAKSSWNSGSIKYNINLTAMGRSWKEQIPDIKFADTLAKKYEARGLYKWTLYNISIRLFNDQGFGPWSKPVFFRTSQDVPDDSPANVKAFAMSSSEIRVSWGDVPKEQRNGIIVGYKVSYIIRNQPLSELFHDAPNNKTHEVVLTDLVGHTEYEVRVLAYTKIGDGYAGGMVRVKTQEGLPGKPRDAHFTKVTLDSIRLEWDAPARPNGNINSYEVQYKRKAPNEAWRTYVNPISQFARSVDIRGLVAESYYTFKIKARTAAGWGEAATVEVLTTLIRGLHFSFLKYTVEV